MRSKNAEKIISYLETKNVGDLVELSDIVNAVGNNNPSRCRQDLHNKILPYADGVIDVITIGRKRNYKIVSSTLRLRKNATMGLAKEISIKPIRKSGGKRKKKVKEPKIIYHEFGVDFNDDYVIMEKDEHVRNS